MIRGRTGQHLGRLLYDDRAAGLGKREYDVLHCGHCNGAIAVGAGQWDSYCSRCGPVHATPACATVCTPFMKKIEEQLRRDAFARAAGLAGR